MLSRAVDEGNVSLHGRLSWQHAIYRAAACAAVIAQLVLPPSQHPCALLSMCSRHTDRVAP